MQSIEPRQYRSAAELRRCVIYLVIGAIAIAILISVVGVPPRKSAPRNDRLEKVAPYFIIPLVVTSVPFFLLAPFTWRLRIDERGIWQRIIWRWQLWSWDDFASGFIIGSKQSDFRDSRSRWFHCSLSLLMMRNSERREVVDAIMRYYKPPPQCKPIDSFCVRVGWRGRAEFTRDAIVLSSRREPRRYQWAEVEQIQIDQRHAAQYGFEACFVVFPDREIKIETPCQLDFKRVWFATAESQNAVKSFLKMRVPTEKLSIWSFESPVADRWRCGRQLRTARTQLKLIPYIAVALAVLNALQIWMKDREPWTSLSYRIWSFVAAVIIGLVVYGPFLGHIYRRHARRRDELLTTLRQLEMPGDGGDDTTPDHQAINADSNRPIMAGSMVDASA